jgi:hypothetical protein
MSTLQRNVPATEFHRFPDLPAEIRLMIWNMIWNMRPGPDIVHTEIQHVGTFGRLKLIVTRPRTILLYINRESRASTCLSKLDLTSFRKPWKAIERPKQPISVDFKRDTFCMVPMAIHCLKLKDLAQIRTAEVTWNQHDWRQSFVSNKRSFLACTGLERLILKIPTSFLGNVIITSEEPDWAEQYTALRPPRHFSVWVSAQRVRLTWEEKLRTLGEHFEEFRKHHPAWIPPKIILKFSGYISDRSGYPRFWAPLRSGYCT